MIERISVKMNPPALREESADAQLLADLSEVISVAIQKFWHTKMQQSPEAAEDLGQAEADVELVNILALAVNFGLSAGELVLLGAPIDVARSAYTRMSRQGMLLALDCHMAHHPASECEQAAALYAELHKD